MRRDYVLIAAVVLVAASTVIASFTAQSGLGELAGWSAVVSVVHRVDLHLSWLLPLTVDAYGVAATRIATNKRRYTAEVRRQAFGHALAAVAVSVLANSVYHLIEARVIVLGATAWVLVVAVSIVPPVALGGLAHLLSVAARDEIEVTVPAVPEPVVVDVAVQPEVVEAVPSNRQHAADLPVAVPAVPALSVVVPPQVTTLADVGKREADDVGDEPDSGDQVQPEQTNDPDAPYYPLALTHFLSDVVSGEQPTVRTIKDQMSVGTDRARRLQAYLGGLVEVAR